MLKYVNCEITFSEIPDEISLCINITGCKNRCKNCHSPWLADDIGEELTFEKINYLINRHKGASCICFMGGDSEPEHINNLAKFIKHNYNLKVAWYSGKQYISDKINIANFDYIKIGPYIPEKGGLTDSNTNQIMYEVCRLDKTECLIDITHKFWKK